MTDTSHIFWGVDVYRTVVFPLNTDGSLQATSMAPYEGLAFEGSHAFTLTQGDPLTITNLGDMRVKDTLILPTRDPTTGELRVGYTHQDIDSQLSGVNKIRSLGEATQVPFGTDRQGSEPDCAILVMQMGHDDAKLTRWHYFLLPRCKIIGKMGSFDQNPWEKIYRMSVSPALDWPWGEALSVAYDGVTEANGAEGTSEGKIALVAWKADGYSDTFPLPTDKPAIATSKINIWNWNDGTQYKGADITTLAVGSIKLASNPTAGDILVAKFEYD